MKTTIPYIKAATYEKALRVHKEITGRNFYESYENCYEPWNFTPERLHNDMGFFVAKDTGDIYYVYKNCSTHGRYGTGELILHKLTIHTAIGNGGFNAVFISEEIEYEGKTLFENEITIIKKNWERSAANRAIFAKKGMIVTTL